MSISIQSDKTGKPHFVLNGRAVRGENVVGIHGDNGATSVSVWNSRISGKIIEHSLADIPPDVERLKIYYPIESTLLSDFEFRRIGDEWDVWVDLQLNGEEWKNRWSIKEFCQAVIDVATAEGHELTYDDEFFGNEFRVQVRTTRAGEIKKIIAETVSDWKRLNDRALAELEHAVVIEFDFPQEIRVPCEQYLLYFGQFLRDLGVQSDTTVRHEGGRTILSTSPVDKRDALEKIRRALEMYLQLSIPPVTSNTDTPVSAHQLIANIYHLQSQLSLARATIEAKDATIFAQATILNFKAAVHSNIPLGEIDGAAEEQRPTEALLGGIITLGKTDPKYGLSVSWAELFRRLRQYFEKTD